MASPMKLIPRSEMAEFLAISLRCDAVLCKNLLAHRIKHLPLLRRHALGRVLANFVHRVHQSYFLRERAEFSFLLLVVDDCAPALPKPCIGQFRAAKIDHQSIVTMFHKLLSHARSTDVVGEIVLRSAARVLPSIPGPARLGEVTPLQAVRRLLRKYRE